MNRYLTKQGDTADGIAWAFYKKEGGQVLERLMEANPGLADLGPSLPAGVFVNLPELPQAAESSQGARLWD